MLRSIGESAETLRTRPWRQSSVCVRKQLHRTHQTRTRPVTLGIGNEIVPIQLAQCWFPGLAILNAKIFLKLNIFGSTFIKQHSEIVMVWSYQNADCSSLYYTYFHIAYSWPLCANMTSSVKLNSRFGYKKQSIQDTWIQVRVIILK